MIKTTDTQLHDALRRYMVFVTLHKPSSQRLLKVGPAIQKVLKSASVAGPELTILSNGCDVTGYLIKSALSPGEIHARIEAPGGRTDAMTPAILEGHDTVLVVEIGPGFASSSTLGRIATWLRRN